MSVRDANLWQWYSGIAAYVATWVAMIVGSLLKPQDTAIAAAELPTAAGGES